MKTAKTQNMLAEQLDSWQASGDMDTILQQHPDAAEDVRPLLETAAQLSRYYAVVPEPPNDLRAGRDIVLRAAEEKRAQRHPTSSVPSSRKGWLSDLRQLPTLLRHNWRLLGAVLAILLLFLPLSVPVARAADNSIPGDLLYPIKMAEEDYRLANAERPEIRAILALTFVNERIEEVRTLVRNDQRIPDTMNNRIYQLTYYALESTAWSTEAVTPIMLEYILWQYNTYVQELAYLKLHVDEKHQQQLNQVYSLCVNQYQMARLARNSPDKFRAAYQAGKPERLIVTERGLLQSSAGDVARAYVAWLTEKQSIRVRD